MGTFSLQLFSVVSPLTRLMGTFSLQLFSVVSVTGLGIYCTNERDSFLLKLQLCIKILDTYQMVN